jgi:hypothetical protein
MSTARPQFSVSRIATLGFFAVLGIVANVIQVTQSIAEGQFSVLTISVAVFAVVVAGALALDWLRSRSALGRADGSKDFAADRPALVVVACLVLLTLSVLTVAVSTVAVAMLSRATVTATSSQIARDSDRAAAQGKPAAGQERHDEASSSSPGQSTVKRADAATSLGNGTYVVGVDVKPGAYRTAGPDGNSTCWWYRLKDTSGEVSAQIASGFTEGPATVTIKETDGAFQSQGCQTWTKVN